MVPPTPHLTGCRGASVTNLSARFRVRAVPEAAVRLSRRAACSSTRFGSNRRVSRRSRRNVCGKRCAPGGAAREIRILRVQVLSVRRHLARSRAHRAREPCARSRRARVHAESGKGRRWTASTSWWRRSKGLTNHTRYARFARVGGGASARVSGRPRRRHEQDAGHRRLLRRRLVLRREIADAAQLAVSADAALSVVLELRTRRVRSRQRNRRF